MEVVQIERTLGILLLLIILMAAIATQGDENGRGILAFDIERFLVFGCFVCQLDAIKQIAK